MNAHLLLSIPASIVPEQEIITFENKRQTYAELLENTGKLAAVLQSYGVRRGDRVGLISTNNPESIESFFAVFQLGAVMVPINYRAKADELAYMIQDAGVKILLIEQRYADLLEPFINESGIEAVICVRGSHHIGVEYSKVMNQVSEPLIDCEDVEEKDLAVLLYTSGTTNKPKGVMITYGTLTDYVMNHMDAADGTPRGSSLVCVPSYHVAGATTLLNSLYTGRRLVLLKQFEAGAWLQALEKEKATHAFLVPTMLKQVMDHKDFFSTELNSLESLSYGAAAMPFPVIRKAVEVFPPTTNFANAFGMTETTSTVSVLGPEDHKLIGTPEEIEKKMKRLSSVGKPLPEVEVMILDENGNSVPVNHIGHVYLRTGKTMEGYWNRPEDSKETLVNGWVNTKDVGWLDEDGYLFLSGRSSDMIIRGGENISPAEIEDVLLEHPQISDVAVIGIPSIDWGEEVLAVVIPKDTENLPQADEIILFCKERLASFKRPTAIEFVTELPRTSTGKLLKRQLRDHFTGNIV